MAMPVLTMLYKKLGEWGKWA